MVMEIDNISTGTMIICLGIALTLTCVSANRNVDDLINEINSKQNLWTAENYFKGSALSGLTRRLGSKPLPKDVEVPVIKHQINFEDIPKFFDSRTNWPECKSIQEIRDQSACGSSWAVSPTSVFSDRFCIHSNATVTPEISARDLMACEDKSDACRGGYPYYAFVYWRDHGIVTGGGYGTEGTCQPYTFPPCEHHIVGSRPPCPSEDYEDPNCVHECDYNSLIYKHDRHYGLSIYQIEGVDQIQAEIMKNGPVTADLVVFEDFPHYRSGIYKRTSDNMLGGGQALRIIGWGEENGTKYWLCANSWNDEWGEKGLFRILRGENECQIEERVYGGIPKLK